MSIRRVLLATNNVGKRAEFAGLLPGIAFVSLRDVGIDDLAEPHADFIANATAKAREASRRSGLPALADDSGLAVDALHGAPGVFSARFGGRHGDDAANRARLLASLGALPGALRGARFRCVIALADENGPLGGRVITTQGEVAGTITFAPRGRRGFGYDPLFVPLGSVCTMAEMEDDEKHDRSHRGAAVRAMAPTLLAYLRESSLNDDVDGT